MPGPNPDLHRACADETKGERDDRSAWRIRTSTRRDSKLDSPQLAPGLQCP